MFLPPPPPDPDQPTAAEQDADRALDEAYDYANRLLGNGTPPPQVRERLMARGLSRKAALTAVDEVIQWRKDQARQKKRAKESGVETDTAALRATGRKNMLIGGVVFLLGVAVTAGTRAAAEAAGGGGFIIARGAILFGAIQFIWGASQSARR